MARGTELHDDSRAPGRSRMSCGGDAESHFPADETTRSIRHTHHLRYTQSFRFRLKDVESAEAEIADGAATDGAEKIPLYKSRRREELHQRGAGKQSHVKGGTVDRHIQIHSVAARKLKITTKSQQQQITKRGPAPVMHSGDEAGRI